MPKESFKAIFEKLPHKAKNDLRGVNNKGVFAEKGARFRGKWGLGAPLPPPPPRPLAPPPPFFWGAGRVYLKIQEGGGSSRREGGGRGGGGPGVCTGNLAGGGGAEAPFTAKTSPFFGENALTVPAPKLPTNKNYLDNYSRALKP